MFNYYRHWAQLLIRQLGELQVTILIQEGVTQGYPLSMVLNRITIVPLAKEFRAAYTGMLYLFYVDDAAFDGSAQHSAQLLKLLMERAADWGYFPEPDNSLFISNTPGQEESTKKEFAAEGLELNFFCVNRYLGAYLGPQEDLGAWLKPQVEAWAHGVRVLIKIAWRYPQSDYAGLGMSLQL